MAIKSEISWKREDEEGHTLHVTARRFGGEWQFSSRSRRYENWEAVVPVPLEDWLTLLDALRRRVPRRLATPAEVNRVVAAIREKYPEAVIPK